MNAHFIGPCSESRFVTSPRGTRSSAKRDSAALRAGRRSAIIGMIRAGDRVMVCLSGGKDSYALLDILLNLRDARAGRFRASSRSTSTRRHPGFPAHVLPEYLTALGVPFHIEVQDTYSVVKRVIPEGKTMCALCSRLRRGVLYRVAERARRDQDRARPPPRRHPRDVFAQPVLRRQAEGDAAEAACPTTARTS